MPGTEPRCTCDTCTAVAQELDATREAPVTAPTPERDPFAIVEQPGAYTPARSAQLRNIANGEYIFDVGRDEATGMTATLAVQLHTVQSGQLADHRILRRRDADGRWDGFASLQEDGTVYVWRRHVELRDTREHRVLNTQFRTMHLAGTRIASNSSVTLNGHTVRLTQRRCNACNRNTTGQAAYCSGCLLNQPPSVTQDERRFMPNITPPAPRVEAPRVVSTPRTSSRFTRPGPSTTTRPRTPLMSEIDPTRIR